MLADAKSALRRRMRDQSHALAAPYRALASAAIGARLAQLSQLPWTRALLVFLPLRDEPDIVPFIRRLLLSGRHLWAPALGGRPTLPAADCLTWRRLYDLDHLQRGPGGFLQPPTPPSRPPGNAMVLVPGLAFTPAGHRLGRGGGHYDRFLARHHGIRVGVCFRHQVLPELPLLPHDLSVNWLVTESITSSRLPHAK